MKKLLLPLILLLLLVGCTPTKKIINNREQTFTEFVIKNTPDENNDIGVGGIDFDAYPALRFIKWAFAKKVI